MTRVALDEIAPHEGLRNEPVFVDTDHEVAWIDTLSKLGCAKIGVGPFTARRASGTPRGCPMRGAPKAPSTAAPTRSTS